MRLVKLSYNLEPSFPIEFKFKQSKILMDDIPNAIVLSLGWLLAIGGLGEPLIFNLHRIAELTNCVFTQNSKLSVEQAR